MLGSDLLKRGILAIASRWATAYHVGPRYRVYFCRIDKVINLLLCGGDKSSQKKDIREAKRILRELEPRS